MELVLSAGRVSACCSSAIRGSRRVRSSSSWADGDRLRDAEPSDRGGKAHAPRSAEDRGRGRGRERVRVREDVPAQV